MSDKSRREIKRLNSMRMYITPKGILAGNGFVECVGAGYVDYSWPLECYLIFDYEHPKED